MRSLSAVWNSTIARIGQLRRDAGHPSLSLPATFSALVGVASDLLSPWADVLWWLLPVLVMTFGISTGLYLKASAQLLLQPAPRRADGAAGETTEGVPQAAASPRSSARVALYSLVAIMVLAPIMLVSMAADNRGVLAQNFEGAAEVQAWLGSHLDRIAEDTGKIRVGVQKVERHMDLAVAMERVDRALATRDGSMQGQNLAMEALLTQGFTWSGADLSGVSLSGARIPGAIFEGARMNFVDVRGADLAGADLSRTTLRYAVSDAATDLGKAKLTSAYAPFADFRGTVFTGADLSEAYLFGADLAGADFTGANLRSAVLIAADLRGAKLGGTDFTGAFLIGALLESADLEGAILENTDLRGAIMSGSQLTGEQMAGACQHEYDAGHGIGYFDLKITERWPSNKYDSGYEYEVLTDYIETVPAPNLSASNLPACPTSDEHAWGYAKWPLQDQFHVERRDIDQTNRRRKVLQHLKDFYVERGAIYAAGPVLAAE